MVESTGGLDLFAQQLSRAAVVLLPVRRTSDLGKSAEQSTSVCASQPASQSTEDAQEKPPSRVLSRAPSAPTVGSKPPSQLPRAPTPVRAPTPAGRSGAGRSDARVAEPLHLPSSSQAYFTVDPEHR